MRDRDFLTFHSDLNSIQKSQHGDTTAAAIRSSRLRNRAFRALSISAPSSTGEADRPPASLQRPSNLSSFD